MRELTDAPLSSQGAAQDSSPRSPARAGEIGGLKLVSGRFDAGGSFAAAQAVA